MLREEVQRRRVAQLFEAADRVAKLPPLTEAKIDAERLEAKGARSVRVVADKIIVGLQK